MTKTTKIHAIAECRHGVFGIAGESEAEGFENDAALVKM